MMLRSLVISLCLAGLTMAQTTPRPRPHGRGPVGPISLEAPNAEARLTKQLGLDATQQNTLHGALEASKVQQQGMTQKMTGLRTELATAMRTGDESGIDRASTDISNLEQQRAAIRAKTVSKLYTSLRSDQKVKFESQVNRAAGVPVAPTQNKAGARRPRPRRAPVATTVPVQQ
jgi:hypothetical protein